MFRTLILATFAFIFCCLSFPSIAQEPAGHWVAGPPQYPEDHENDVNTGSNTSPEPNPPIAADPEAGVYHSSWRLVRYENIVHGYWYANAHNASYNLPDQSRRTMASYIKRTYEWKGEGVPTPLYVQGVGVGGVYVMVTANNATSWARSDSSVVGPWWWRQADGGSGGATPPSTPKHVSKRAEGQDDLDWDFDWYLHSGDVLYDPQGNVNAVKVTVDQMITLRGWIDASLGPKPDLPVEEPPPLEPALVGSANGYFKSSAGAWGTFKRLFFPPIP